MKKILDQPLFHFIIVALLIFFLNEFSNNDTQEDLVLSKQTQEFLIDQNERLLGRKVTSEERQNIFESYIQDELLLNMAYDRGLDRLDARIRESLLKNMRGVLLAEIEDPNPDSLETYLNAQRDKYLKKAAIDFESISIIGDKERDTTRVDSISFNLLEASYGTRYANFIFNLPIGQVSNPIRNGEHLVQFKVLKYYTDKERTIDSLSLLADYRYLKSQQSIKNVINSYSENYNIIIE